MRRRRPLGVRVHVIGAAVALALTSVAVTGLLVHRAVDREVAPSGRTTCTSRPARSPRRRPRSITRRRASRPTGSRRSRATARWTTAHRAAGDAMTRPSPARPARRPRTACPSRSRWTAGSSAAWRRVTAAVGRSASAGAWTTSSRRACSGRGRGRHPRAPALADRRAADGAPAPAADRRRAPHGARGDRDLRGAAGGSRETAELASTLDRLAAALRRQDELRRATRARRRARAAQRARRRRGPARGAAGRDVVDEKTTMERTARDARRLNRLVDDVLLLAEAQKPSLLVRKSPVDLHEICQSAPPRTPTASPGAASPSSAAPRRRTWTATPSGSPRSSRTCSPTRCATRIQGAAWSCAWRSATERRCCRWSTPASASRRSTWPDLRPLLARSRTRASASRRARASAWRSSATWCSPTTAASRPRAGSGGAPLHRLPAAHRPPASPSCSCASRRPTGWDGRRPGAGGLAPPRRDRCGELARASSASSWTLSPAAPATWCST